MTRGAQNWTRSRHWGLTQSCSQKLLKVYRKHEAKTLTDPAEYGLEYSTYGTRLVFLSKPAVKKLFDSSKLKGYVHECSRPNCDVCQAGESLWQRNGPICQRARHTQAEKVRDAIKQHLRHSASTRADIRKRHAGTARCCCASSVALASSRACTQTPQLELLRYLLSDIGVPHRFTRGFLHVRSRST